MSFGRPSIIFSRNNNNSALTVEQIKNLAPAVYAETKAENLSDRYVSLRSSDLIPIMQDYGYSPVQAIQKSSRKNSPHSHEHNAHMISFARTSQADYDNCINPEEVRPEIILYNSHDGSSAVKLFAGCYRFICSNGIIAGEGFNARAYHSKTAIQGFEDMLKTTVENLPVLMQRIQRLKNTQLDYDQQYQMARLSAASRWELYGDLQDKEKAGTYACNETFKNLLQVSRNEDNFQDAFTVFNRIQEGVIRGKAYVKSITEHTPEGNLRKARPVGSVKENIRINSELWDIADSFVDGEHSVKEQQLELEF